MDNTRENEPVIKGCGQYGSRFYGDIAKFTIQLQKPLTFSDFKRMHEYALRHLEKMDYFGIQALQRIASYAGNSNGISLRLKNSRKPKIGIEKDFKAEKEENNPVLGSYLEQLDADVAPQSEVAAGAAILKSARGKKNYGLSDILKEDAEDIIIKVEPNFISNFRRFSHPGYAHMSFRHISSNGEGPVYHMEIEGTTREKEILCEAWESNIRPLHILLQSQ